jgi:hypothetical protein
MYVKFARTTSKTGDPRRRRRRGRKRTTKRKNTRRRKTRRGCSGWTDARS